MVLHKIRGPIYSIVVLFQQSGQRSCFDPPGSSRELSPIPTLSIFIYLKCGLVSQIEDLAEGAFGFVQRARNKETGKEVAIKFLPRGSAINKHVGIVPVSSALYHSSILQCFSIGKLSAGF